MYHGDDNNLDDNDEITKIIVRPPVIIRPFVESLTRVRLVMGSTSLLWSRPRRTLVLAWIVVPIREPMTV